MQQVESRCGRGGDVPCTVSVTIYFTVNILRNRKDAVIVQTSFWLPIVIVVIHTMVSENIDHQL